MMQSSQQLQYEIQQSRLRDEVEDGKHTPSQAQRIFDTYKRQGDTAFKAFRYEEAIHAYTMALIVKPDPVTYANRSLAHFKCESYGSALEDGRSSVQLDPTYTKGFYRIGVCEFALQNYEKAIEAFTKVLQLSPTETGARHQLTSARKALREQQFANALSDDDDDSSASSAPLHVQGFLGVKGASSKVLPAAFDRLNWALQIDKSWRGPKPDLTIDYMAEKLHIDGTVPVQIEAPGSARKLTSRKYTREFVEESVQWFASDRSREYPKIFVHHILKDFTLMMKSLPTVVDYRIPTLDDIDCTESQAECYEQGTWTDCEGDEEEDDEEAKTEQDGDKAATTDATTTTTTATTVTNGNETDPKTMGEDDTTKTNDDSDEKSSGSGSENDKKSASQEESSENVAKTTPTMNNGDESNPSPTDEKTMMGDNSPQPQQNTSGETPPPSMSDETPPQVTTDQDVAPMVDDDEKGEKSPQSDDTTTTIAETTSATTTTTTTISEDSTKTATAEVSKKRKPRADPLRSVYKAGKLNVCGDTHGQFWDLLNIFKLQGEPSALNPFLFNGDYVDRGSFGYELVLTLMLWKLHCPMAMHMTRGNHETVNMNRSFGFYGEVIHKADNMIFDCFTQAFNALPLAYVLGNKVFILHGGLFSDDSSSLKDVRKIDRFRQPPENGGLMVDCLWSDPHPFFKGRRASVRGAGCQFGADVTKAWLQRNGLELVVRSHEMKHQGYEVTHDGKLVTIFSAPNYCIAEGGRITMLDGTSTQIQNFSQFEQTPILSYSQHQNTTQAQSTHQWNRLDQGIKSVVDVVLADGSIVKCTPDHQFVTTTNTITRNNDSDLDDIDMSTTCLPANQLVIGRDSILQTVSGIDITQDFALDGERYTKFSTCNNNNNIIIEQLSTAIVTNSEQIDHDFSLTINSNQYCSRRSQDRAPMYAFCRLLGLVWAQTQSQNTQTNNIQTFTTSNQIDAKAIQHDLKTAFCLDHDPKIAPKTLTPSITQYTLEHPLDAFTMPISGVLPSFLSQESTPQPFIREFLAAYLGQNSTTIAPEYQSQTQSFSPLVLGDDHTLVKEMAQLYSQFDIFESQTATTTTQQYPLVNHDTFYTTIGFRYAAEKLSKLAIAVTWDRISNKQQQQQQTQDNHLTTPNLSISQFISTISYNTTTGFATWSVPIVNIIDNGEMCETFDLQVENTHLFTCDGAVVHNCDSMGNKGAVMVFDHSYGYTFTQFEAVNHPPVRAMFYADPYLR